MDAEQKASLKCSQILAAGNATIIPYYWLGGPDASEKAIRWVVSFVLYIRSTIPVKTS